jgi:hypothetical protein
LICEINAGQYQRDHKPLFHSYFFFLKNINAKITAPITNAITTVVEMPLVLLIEPALESAVLDADELALAIS